MLEEQKEKQRTKLGEKFGGAGFVTLGICQGVADLLLCRNASVPPPGTPLLVCK